MSHPSKTNRSGTIGIFALSCLAGGALTACETVTGPPATIAAEVDTAVSKSDIATIMDWWAGDFNNDAQIAALEAAGEPIWIRGTKEGLGGHLPVSSRYRVVDMPAFGENVLYLEERTFGKDDGDQYRQRIYTIDYNAETDTVAVKLWYFKDRDTYWGAWNDLSQITALTPDDFSALPDPCDLIVTKTPENRYEMTMTECIFGTSQFDYQVSLGADSFWYRDKILNAETGEITATAGNFDYHKLDRE